MAHEGIHTDANDPSNVTNPEHAQHHIVTPLQYTYVFATLLLFTGITVGAAYIDSKLGESGDCAGYCVLQGGDRHPVLHACGVPVAADQDDDWRGILPVYGADYDDADGLHQPGLGYVVGRTLRVSERGLASPFGEANSV